MICERRSLQIHTCSRAVTWGGVVEILSCASGYMVGTSQQYGVVW